MSCHATLVATSAGGTATANLSQLLDRGAERVDQLERRWSRFLDDSEISGLNRAGGDPRRCSNDTERLVERMVAGWHATEGAFDPSLLGVLVELGYAASRDDALMCTSLAPDAGHDRRVDQIEIDPATSVVRLPVGLTLDPGGIGKGLAADLVSDELTQPDEGGGASGALVEIGGDIRVRGRGPDDGCWSIAVAHPGPREPEVVRLRDGGVATSTSRFRTWAADGEHRHHLLDPATNRPTDTDVVSCTVIAGTAAWAEVFTKCAFVEGADRALERYESKGLAARIVTVDGRTSSTPSWKEFAT